MKSPFYILYAFLMLCCLPVVSFSEENTSPPPSNTGMEFGSVEERRLLAELQQERQTLDREKEEIAVKKNELKRLETEVDKKLRELTTIRKDIEDLLSEKSLQEHKRIKELAKMYEKMEPRNAANIFIGLDKNLTISILARMKTKSAAKILDTMDRRRAIELTAAFSKLQQKYMEEKNN